MLRVLQSPSATERIAAAAEFIRSFAAATELLLVGSSREAVDDLVRGLAHTSGATFGLHHFSFTRLAARLASRSWRWASGPAPQSVRKHWQRGPLTKGRCETTTEATPPEGKLDDEFRLLPV